MPMELLRELATGTLPRVLSDPANIDKLRVLRAAGLVSADMPEMTGSGEVVRQATCLSITDKGRQALAEGGWLELP